MKNFHSNQRDRPKSTSYSAYLRNQGQYGTQSYSNCNPSSKSFSKNKPYSSNNISKNQQGFEAKEMKISLQRKRTNSLSQDHFKIELAVKGFPKKKDTQKSKPSYSQKILHNHNYRYDDHKKKTKKDSQQQLIVRNLSQDNHTGKIKQHRRHKSNTKMNISQIGANKNLEKKNRSYSALQGVHQISRNASMLTNKQKNISKAQKNEEIPIKLNYSYRSRQGALFSNPNKPNQDNFAIHQSLLNRKGKQIHVFAVADGHGIHGHHVSKLIVENLPKLISQQMSNEKNSIPKTLVKAYDSLQSMLSLNAQQINILCSGSTLVTILFEGSTVICANTGDSRAILARQVDRKCWEMIYLSEDHKPSLERQKKRIHKHGGRIHSFKDQKGMPVGPLRVWLPNQNVQGLAMSRSLGDNISKQVGVTHEPQLIKIQLQTRDKFILLASDGVWQFITNQQVLQLIVPFYRDNKIEEACDALLKLAYERWTTQDTSVVDDITFVLIFLNK